MFCPKCGKETSGNFCDFCGAVIDQQPQPTNFSTYNQSNMQTMESPQNQASFSNEANRPSAFAIIISGLIPLVGWIMGIVVLISGESKKGSFYIVNATVCFLIAFVGIMIAMVIPFGSIIALAGVIAFLVSRKKKVDEGIIQF